MMTVSIHYISLQMTYKSIALWFIPFLLPSCFCRNQKYASFRIARTLPISCILPAILCIYDFIIPESVTISAEGAWQGVMK